MLQLAPGLYFVTVVVAVSTVFDPLSVQDIDSEKDEERSSRIKNP
jgi:hypothetical protein